VANGTIQGSRILVVEDEYIIAWDIANILKDAGAEVLGPYGRVEEVLALLEARPEITAAILDVRLHGASVFPVADILRRRGVPFIFATGCDTDELPPAHRTALHCQKPFNHTHLIDLLATEVIPN
jgi:DNA-binding NtrC family response regulator